MKRSRRIRIALLALMLAASHAVLTSHVTGHFEPALEQCELCFGQNHLTSAVPAPEHVLPVLSQRCRPAIQSPRPAPPERLEHAHRQRAPPIGSPQA